MHHILFGRKEHFLLEGFAETLDVIETALHTNGTDVRVSRTYSHFALIIGNEGKGVEEELLDLCDEYLYIKMNDLCESLNAAVAASILMYEISNK